jgi:hypothetical protein
MTKEVLKLALVALEEINQLSIGENAVCLPAEIDTAMDAIKEALAQPEQDGKCKYCTDGCHACDARKLPEQEPFMASYEFKQYGYYKDGKGTLKLGNIPATQPPQRTWVGLTDEEYTALWGMKPDLLNFFHKIEAKLKEKNT